MNHVHSAALIAEAMASYPLHTARAVVGFDGFIDEIASVVSRRTGPGAADFVPVAAITDMAKIVHSAAGRSLGREIFVRTTEPGGNAPNFADALMNLGVAADFYGTLGDPIDPVFEPFARRCHSCTTLGSRCGRTLALEFDDGKLMLNQTAGLEAVDRDCIRRAIQAQGLGDACRAADLIVLANWSRYPNMTECWRVLRDQAISGAERRPWIVIDLADPAGRSEDDIREMLEVISSFPQYARVALSLNRNEAAVVGGSLGFRVEQGTPNDALSILDRLGIDLAIIHARDRSVAASTKGTADFQTAFTPSPARTIGAGDRFGAGVGAALIAGIEPALAVYIGNVAAGFFVRTTRAPKMDELVAFAKNWDREVAANP